MNAMLDLVRRHESGERVGIYSVCSAHPLVLEAAMRLAKRTGSLSLVEATSNQVNQDGGYTGMVPTDFRDRLLSIAATERKPRERNEKDGDQHGPNAWQSQPSATALQKAGVM